jgi:hypothetical protein
MARHQSFERIVAVSILLNSLEPGEWAKSFGARFPISNENASCQCEFRARASSGLIAVCHSIKPPHP